MFRPPLRSLFVVSEIPTCQLTQLVRHINPMRGKKCSEIGFQDLLITSQVYYLFFFFFNPMVGCVASPLRVHWPRLLS